MARVNNHTGAYNDHPFTGSGASLYATSGTTVQYRAVRVLPTSRRRGRYGWIKGTSQNHNIDATSVLKTTRRASAASPAESIDYTLPVSFASQTVTFDVRQYADDVESEVDNFRTQTITFDGSLEDTTGILGTAELIDTEALAGGIVRIRFRYYEEIDGVQPTQFVAVRTAGPTSPANVTVSYTAGQGLVEIETAALSDASAYTYKIRAENGSTTKDVLTGIIFTADATGPSAPGSGSAEAI